MQTAQEIYQSAILDLPPEERLRLAALILTDLAAPKQKEEKLSAVALLKSFPKGRGFKTNEDVEAYLRGERESWDR